MEQQIQHQTRPAGVPTPPTDSQRQQLVNLCLERAQPFTHWAVEDLENEALNWWASQPETERVYIKATLPLPASFLEQKAEGVPGSEPSDQNPGTDGCEGGTNPIPQVHQLLSPSLSCPFVCGIEHLVRGPGMWQPMCACGQGLQEEQSKSRSQVPATKDVKELPESFADPLKRVMSAFGGPYSYGGEADWHSLN
eukprot:1151686-Pelagomonas_calceolata.AAC.12